MAKTLPRYQELVTSPVTEWDLVRDYLVLVVLPSTSEVTRREEISSLHSVLAGIRQLAQEEGVFSVEGGAQTYFLTWFSLLTSHLIVIRFSQKQ